MSKGAYWHLYADKDSKYLLLIILAIVLVSCTTPAENCPSSLPVALDGVEQFDQDKDVLLRFPLDDPRENFITDAAKFADSGGHGSGRMYHAAEDYYWPAGTPVYAMADGKISYSGRMGGYGWLIIIDHPQFNLYSLYGHLSPSSWRLRSGSVVKGDLIAYLGDSDENGGSRQNPLATHLHFGLRGGQRSDFPARGEWRWMAGWIKPCPQDLGWLQPSSVIMKQENPDGGFRASRGNFFEMWSVELLMGGIYFLGVLAMIIFGVKTQKPYLILLSGGVFTATGIYFYSIGWKMSYAILALALFLIGIGILMLIRRLTNNSVS
jgi:murein DD-endopeptidase MepM/ murein hydrolase activator NlpD